ncbi:hypothetical protein ACFLRB_05100 [Acidobacteriota bacterium]
MNNIVYFLLILIVLFGVFLVYFNRKLFKRYLFSSSRIAAGRDVILNENLIKQSPIMKLSFEESLNVDVFANELRDFSLDYAEEIFKEIYGIKKAVQKSFRLIEEVKTAGNSGKITWKLSEKGKTLFKRKSVEWPGQKGSEKLLPRIFNQKGGIIRLTKLANIAVNAAHIISGAEQAKELNVIDKKIDYLLAVRKIDRLSKLESNFYLARELLAHSTNPVNRGKILDLHREVIEIRTNWRNEIEQELKHIEDPHSKPFFDKLFSTRKSRDKLVYAGLSRFEEEIALIDFSFIYDIALCESIGHINSSLGVEINRLEKTKNLLRRKAGYLTKAKDGDPINKQIDQLDGIIRRYRNFLPDQA